MGTSLVPSDGARLREGEGGNSLSRTTGGPTRACCPCCGGSMIIVETFQRGGAACRETLLPSLHRCRPAAAKVAYYAIDHAKIASSTAAAATNSRPRSPSVTDYPASAAPTQDAAPSNPHSRQAPNPAPRGFLPGGLSDAGPLTPGPPLTRTGIRNPAPTRQFAPAASDIGFAPDSGRSGCLRVKKFKLTQLRHWPRGFGASDLIGSRPFGR